MREGNGYLKDSKPDEALTAYERAKDSLGQAKAELWLNQGLAHFGFNRREIGLNRRENFND